MKTIVAIGSAAMIAAAASLTPAPAEARGGAFIGGLAAGAVIGGLAAGAYGPYGYGPYYRPYGYYGPAYDSYAYYDGPAYYHRYHRYYRQPYYW